MQKFGDRLRLAREGVGLSQGALAGRVIIAGRPLSKQAISLLEQGEREPAMGTLQGLYEVLRCEHAARGRPFDAEEFLTGRPRSRTIDDAVRRRDFLGVAAVFSSANPLMIAALNRTTTPQPLDAHRLDIWERRTNNFAAERPVAPPTELLPGLEVHLTVLQVPIVQEAGPAHLRRRLLSIAARTAGLCGWAHLMAEHRIEASQYLELGLEWAREADDRDAMVLLLTIRADLVSPVHRGGVGGDSGQARAALEEAIALATPRTARVLLAGATLRLAEEHAHAGDVQAAERLMAAGLDICAGHSLPDSPLRPVWPTWAPDTFAGSILLGMGRAQEASDVLAAVPDGRPFMRCDQAAAAARMGEPEEAARLLGIALMAARDLSYKHAETRARGVFDREMAGFDVAAVGQLGELLAAR